jgi:hypothetical protein
MDPPKNGGFIGLHNHPFVLRMIGLDAPDSIASTLQFINVCRLRHPRRVSSGGFLSRQSLLLELLLSGFFAVACFRARATAFGSMKIAPRAYFVLTDRLERLRRTRWQWASMVLLLVLVRLQWGTPMVAELTVLAQFILFLALPAQKAKLEAIRRR